MAREGVTKKGTILRGDQLGQHGADVGVQVIPHDHQRAGELLVVGVQQAGVVGLGEAFAQPGKDSDSAAPGRTRPAPGRRRRLHAWPGDDGYWAGQNEAGAAPGETAPASDPGKAKWSWCGGPGIARPTTRPTAPPPRQHSGRGAGSRTERTPALGLPRRRRPSAGRFLLRVGGRESGRLPMRGRESGRLPVGTRVRGRLAVVTLL